MRKSKNYSSLCVAALALALMLTACGKNTTTGSTSGNNDPTLGLNSESDSVANDVGDTAMEIANDVGGAVNDLVGNNGFDNYTDAHDYFLDTMGNYHSDADFEVRNESKDLKDYQEGSKGYHFSLYDKNDTAGKMFGEFYVDATTGMIYRVGDNGKIEEYPARNTSADKSNNKGTISQRRR